MRLVDSDGFAAWSGRRIRRGAVHRPIAPRAARIVQSDDAATPGCS